MLDWYAIKTYTENTTEENDTNCWEDYALAKNSNKSKHLFFECIKEQIQIYINKFGIVDILINNKTPLTTIQRNFNINFLEMSTSELIDLYNNNELFRISVFDNKDDKFIIQDMEDFMNTEIRLFKLEVKFINGENHDDK